MQYCAASYSIHDPTYNIMNEEERKEDRFVQVKNRRTKEERRLARCSGPDLYGVNPQIYHPETINWLRENQGSLPLPDQMIYGDAYRKISREPQNMGKVVRVTTVFGYLQRVQNYKPPVGCTAFDVAPSKLRAIANQ